MGLARTLAVTLTGLAGHIVDVEAHSVQGLPGFTLVGLPDTAVRESRERVRAALSTCGVTWGEQRLTVNLSPADLRKTGTGLDLALALAVLGARGRLGRSAAGLLGRTVYIGELGLDGSVHSVRGVLPSVQAAVAAGVEEIVVAQEAAAEAELVPGARVTAVRHVGQLVERYGGRLSAGVAAAVEQITEAGTDDAPTTPTRDAELPDLADVVGQSEARQALEVAAAGGHHLMMVGPPGTGKTMLAERLPSILPPLEQTDAVIVTSLHSVAGIFDPAHGLITRPPLRAPHHTATRAAVVGGGSGLPRPGDVSLAHRGVLFLDEAPEFSAGVLDCLRQPLETGTVTIDRGATSHDCPVHCWTGSTSRSRSVPSVPLISLQRAVESPAPRWRSASGVPAGPRSADWPAHRGASTPRSPAPTSEAPTVDSALRSAAGS